MFDRVRDFLSRRRQAYARVFDTDAVNDPNGDRRVVIDDLAKFCKFGESAFHPDPRVEAAILGRQEVFARILDHARLDAETLFEKYNTSKFRRPANQE